MPVGPHSAGDVTRLRLIVEGERAFEFTGEAGFTPTAQIGLRHDGGDAETGMGIEVGAGMRYTWGALTVEGRVRTLVAHEDSGYREWGASGAGRERARPHARAAARACHRDVKHSSAQRKTSAEAGTSAHRERQ